MILHGIGLSLGVDNSRRAERGWRRQPRKERRAMFQIVVPADGTLLPIGEAKTSVRRRVFGQLTEQATSLPIMVQVAFETKSTIARQKK